MKLSKDTVIKILDTIYDNAEEGLPGILSVKEEVQKEKIKYKNPQEHIDSVIKWAVAKSSCAGFASSVGGIITLPTLPFGMSVNLYIQLRMIIKIAYISGLDIKSEEVKTFIYCCLAGSKAIKDILKSVGIKIGQKLTQKMITGISGKVLIKINKLVGFRLFTKFGSKGVFNFGKMVPIAGGIIGGYIDGHWCYSSGKMAKKLFFKNPKLKENQE